MADDNATLGEQILNVTKAEMKAKIQPDGVSDDLGREAVAAIGDRSAGSATDIRRDFSPIPAQVDSETVHAVSRPDLTRKLTDLCVLELTRRSVDGVLPRGDQSRLRDLIGARAKSAHHCPVRAWLVSAPNFSGKGRATQHGTHRDRYCRRC